MENIITQVSRPSKPTDSLDSTNSHGDGKITNNTSAENLHGAISPDQILSPLQNQNQSSTNNQRNDTTANKSPTKKTLLQKLFCCCWCSCCDDRKQRPKRKTKKSDGVTTVNDSNNANVITENNISPNCEDNFYLRQQQQSSNQLAVGNNLYDQYNTVTEFLLPPQLPEDANKPCMVIDLDETLVHSSFKPIGNADFIVPVEIDGVVHQVYVAKRPYVDEFLEKMGELYECILFTASLAKYADPVADLLDKWKVFRSRLFRDACVFHRGNYVKDLNKLGRNLQRIVIVDNSPASYIFHPDNAVPVASWFDDSSDTELLYLIPFFERLSSVENVYSVLRNSNHPFNINNASLPSVIPTSNVSATTAMNINNPNNGNMTSSKDSIRNIDISNLSIES